MGLSNSLIRLGSKEILSMDAAVLHEYGTPQFGTFDDPVQQLGTEIVTVTAAAISNFDLVFASGQHFLRPAQLCLI
jgi:hypothetical protein